MKKFVAAIFFLLIACTPTMRTPQYSQAEIDRELFLQQEYALDQAGVTIEGIRRKKIHIERVEEVAPRIRRGAAALCREYRMKPRNCLFEIVLKTKGEVNAFADGDKIYITPAIVELTKTDAELGFVIAHEYAHNILSHSTADLGNLLLGALVGVAIEGGGGSGEGMARGAKVGAEAFSPEFEREADYMGLYILARAGYDLQDTPNIWRRLSAMKPDGMYRNYFSYTHPVFPERVIGMQKAIAEIERKKQQGLPLLPNGAPNEALHAIRTLQFP